MKTKKFFCGLSLSLLTALPLVTFACSKTFAKQATQADVNAEQAVVNAWSAEAPATSALSAANEVAFNQAKATELGFGKLTFKTDLFDYKVTHDAKTSSGNLVITITVYDRKNPLVKGMPHPIDIRVQMPVVIDLQTLNAPADLFGSINEVTHFKQTTSFAALSADLVNGEHKNIKNYFNNLNKLSLIKLTYGEYNLDLKIDLSKSIDSFSTGLLSHARAKFANPTAAIRGIPNPLVVAAMRLNMEALMTLTGFLLFLPEPCWDACMSLLDEDRAFLTTIDNSLLHEQWTIDKKITINPYPVIWEDLSEEGTQFAAKPLVPIIPIYAEFVAWLLDLDYKI